MAAASFVLLAALGAAVRCIATDGWPGRHRGTLLVNVAGALGLGLLVGAGAPPVAVAAGGLGALTTFSTFAADVVRLRETSGRTVAAAHVAATLVLGIAAARLGLELTA